LTKIEEKPLETDEKAQPNISQEETKEKLGNNDKPSACHYHMGYLSERSSKENISDECLVCKDIVDCMLRKMRQ
jgi:hypothetical protein